MRKQVSLLALGLVLAGHSATMAQDAKELAPRVPTPSTTVAPQAPTGAQPLPDGNKQILAALKGAVFRSSVEAIQTKGTAASGVDVAAVPLLNDPAFISQVTPFLGQPVTMSKINEIARLVVTFYRSKDRPLVDVVVPEQDINNGVIQFAVTEFKAGKITAQGNQWFSDDTLLAAVSGKPGEVVDNAALLADVDWLNRNPFRHIDLVYQRGQEVGKTDVILQTTDRLPVRPYAGYENTGTRSTGTGRVLAGFNWGDAFGLDHLLSYQATASGEVFQKGMTSRLKAQSASYTIPLPWRDRLSILGIYSASSPDMPSVFRQKGTSWQASTRYEIPLPHSPSLTHQLNFGTDFKRSNNNLEFGGSQVYGSSTEIAQGLAEYSGTLLDGLGATALTGDLFLSPGHLAPGNNDRTFQASGGRAGATADYAYSRVSLERLTRLGDLTWALKGNGQWSNATLLSSEELGVGGSSTVRGFQEYEAMGDQGYIAISELRSPVYSPLKRLDDGLGDQLQFLTFIDFGRTFNKRIESGIRQQSSLAGAGVGVRYSIDSNLTAKFDFAKQLNGLSSGSDSGARAHFSVMVSY